MREEEFMRVLVFKEGNFWVAQGLDVNIVTSVEGDDIDRLMQRFGLQVELNKNFDLPPVPKEFEDIWQNAADINLGNNGLTIRQVA